jgi:uncharacterized integral membrane protein
MNKRVIWALILIVLSILVLIFNRQEIEVNFLITEIKAMASLILLFFIGVGVVIGVLLR